MTFALFALQLWTKLVLTVLKSEMPFYAKKKKNNESITMNKENISNAVLTYDRYHVMNEAVVYTKIRLCSKINYKSIF
jgi:hypothetical protein